VWTNPPLDTAPGAWLGQTLAGKGLDRDDPDSPTRWKVTLVWPTQPLNHDLSAGINEDVVPLPSLTDRHVVAIPLALGPDHPAAGKAVKGDHSGEISQDGQLLSSPFSRDK